MERRHCLIIFQEEEEEEEEEEEVNIHHSLKYGESFYLYLSPQTRYFKSDCTARLLEVTAF